MKGLALEECTRRDPTQFHILVVAYRNTAHYSIKAPENRCMVRWASQASACLTDAAMQFGGPLKHLCTVAILAQGTSWAVAVTQAFLSMGSNPRTPLSHLPRSQLCSSGRCLPQCKSFFHEHIRAGRLQCSLTAIPRRMHRISSDLRS